MKINLDALKALELKLAEYSKANGAIAEHKSANTNSCVSCDSSCRGRCYGGCDGSCRISCSGSCDRMGK